MIIRTCIIAFVSGALALAYETLWNRVLSNVIGATLFSATVVIVVFFVSLSLGYAIIRRWPAIRKHPWKAFSLMQLGIAISIFSTVLFATYKFYPEISFSSPLLRAITQVITAIFLIAPASFVMGGTILPLIESIREYPYRTSLVYGINTLGGVIGIGITTFYSIYAIGIRLSLIVCIMLNIILALFSLKYHFSGETNALISLKEKTDILRKVPSLSRICIFILAIASGVTVLGFEVILLYAYRQVGQNSAWSFGAMLMLVISMLGLASLLSSCKPLCNVYSLHYIFPVIATGMILFPDNFIVITHTMQFTSIASGSITRYMWSLLWVGLASSGSLFLLMGIVFPWLLRKVSIVDNDNATLHLGSIFAGNSLGACLGAVITQWVLIPCFGLWRACIALSFVPLISWVVLNSFLSIKNGARRRISYVLFLLPLCIVPFKIRKQIPLVTPWPESNIVDVKCGPEGIVAVIRRSKDNLWRLSVNNNFVLSSSKDVILNRRMSHLPLLLHPSPRNICYIGLATGLTASGAVFHNDVQYIKVIEISPLVIKMSLRYFGQFTGHFERDPRVHIVEDDGVHFMATTKDKFDVIIGDVFFPWKDGVQRLYSWEHFANIRRRLKEGGIFCQWIPFYQIDSLSLSVIAESFVSVFPYSSVIRVFMGSKKEFIGFIGKKSETFYDFTKDRNIWTANLKKNFLIRDSLLRDPRFFDKMFVGKLSELSTNAKINTLDKPILEPFVIRAQTQIWQKFNH